MQVRGVRGAITSEGNNSSDILNNTTILLKEIFKQNNIIQEDLVSIFFTLTSDLDAVFPAVAARQLGLTDVPLMCLKEIDVPGSLRSCIRILVQFNTDKTNTDLHHIYLKGAVVLRPDLNRGES